MPCTFDLDAAARLRVHSYTGIVDDAGTIAAYTALVETPGYRHDVNDLAYGVGRTYEMLRGEGTPEEVRVFRSMDDARRWVALP